MKCSGSSKNPEPRNRKSKSNAAAQDSAPRLKGVARAPYYYTAFLPNEGRLMVEALERRPWWQPSQKVGTFNFWWGPNGERFDFRTLERNQRQLLNRFEDHREICTKTQLAINLQKYAERFRADVWTIIPTTFVLSGGSAGCKLLQANKAAFRSAAAGEWSEGDAPTAKALKGKIWIVKPGGRNRGLGIEVFEGLEAVGQFMRAQPSMSMWVVQKYLEDPFLINGRKFDIRLLVLVTHNMEVFIYKDSYVRTCTAKYNKENLEDKSIHLTNDFVQKHLDDYGKFEDANKLSMDEFRTILAQHGCDFELTVWPQIVESVQHVFRASLAKLNPRRIEYCFELLGFDFMLDSSFHTWLIEVNTSPALFRHGRVLTEMMPRMIEEVAQKVVDRVFPPDDPADLPEPLNCFEQVPL
ncbi:hypothetical protein CYMTET_47602 [Cymbomonas tetramitiformis]|uniref:Tubulin-tyrosine ligase n=1 Tax=Cymbomonas tetramitiformis TaxID=36881 RepID=A0AAE0BTT7_9CHLO|nr:hypothetical protein CYMTET_47602 [Cymbomonas tetramitiformis]